MRRSQIKITPVFPAALQLVAGNEKSVNVLWLPSNKAVSLKKYYAVDSRQGVILQIIGFGGTLTNPRHSYYEGPAKF
jgi:hypothetical protein